VNKLNLLFLTFIFGFSCAAFAWFPTNAPPVVYINRVASFHANDGSYTNALDWGTNGYPWQVEISIGFSSNNPISLMTLQYTLNTINPDATNWITIATIKAVESVNVNRIGVHFGNDWQPPDTTSAYLLRLYITLTNGVTSGDLNENNITALGGVTWENWEVVGMHCRNNKVPGD
jgi:hypothetical protein